MLRRFDHGVGVLAGVFLKVSAVGFVAMMMLTASDVFLRFLRRPIPGAYELVGFISSVAISFSLAYTALEKGHISVEFLYQKAPEKIQHLMEAVNHLVALAFFVILSWQCAVYGVSQYNSGEVSPTLQMPIYPFAFGTSLGTLLLSAVLLVFFIQSAKRLMKR